MDKNRTTFNTVLTGRVTHHNSSRGDGKNIDLSREAQHLFESSSRSAPDSTFIRTLHRAHDGCISFHRETDDFQNLFSVPANHVEARWPTVSRYLEDDAYFSVNGFWRGGFGASKYLLGLDRAYRESEGLRWLTACFADLDCRTVRLSPQEVLAQILAMENQSQIPRASCFIASGRGLWVFYLLHDEKTGRGPQRAWPEKTTLYRAVEKAIVQRFAEFGADAGASDPARITRVPGSINAKSGRTVKTWIREEAEGHPPTYTLSELAEKFGATPSQDHTAKKAASPQPNKMKRNGWLAMQENRRKQFAKLADLRGGFEEGCRNRAALVCATLLAAQGLTDAQIVEKVVEFGSDCRPPLSRRECEKAAAGARRYRRVRDQTIADWLNVTIEESGELAGWPPATCFGGGERKELTASHGDRRRARRALIRDLVRKAKAAPPVRKMLALLDENGHRASVGTVHADYRAVGIAPHRPARRVGRRLHTRQFERMARVA